ncbi:unnamed protein product [Cuscuta campestris]|uniref:RING-type E3 ubiquitin transferase n=1 Tax=Cuscuta campestris TaxID=132261 RepID=A0A484MN81_9ASTE|nr:unnamed protein product [Cuscuta campestris]
MMHTNELSGKKPINGPLNKRIGSRDAPKGMDKNIQLCPRSGCSGRLNYTRMGCTPKPYPSRQILNPSNGKEVVASSSRSSPLTKKSHIEYQTKASSHTNSDDFKAKAIQDVTVVKDQIHSSRNTESRKSTVLETGCSSGLSDMKNHQKPHCNNHKSVNQDNLRPSNVRFGTRSKPTTVENGYRTPKLSPTSFPLPHSSQSRFMKKKSSESESSSASSSVRNRSSRSFSKEGRGVLNNRGVLISDVNHVVSDRNMNSRVRARDQDNNGNSRFPQPKTSNSHMFNSSYLFSAGASSSESSSYNLPRNDGGDTIRSLLPFPSSDFSIGQSNNHDDLWRYNMDEISGALLQLETIEHDEELTYEQLLAHESNVFFNGMSFYDHHREMRLDIDNMSYEELLALGERMGTVSTALSEESMSKCLSRSIYQVSFKEVGVAGLKGDEDDSKCSICQEEYVFEDEIGKLECEHRYHFGCVQQWLRMKNWCPICKASAVSSRPTSPP